MIARIGSAVHDRGAADDRDAVAVAQLQGLAPALDGEPDADFRTATRARLVAMAAVRSPAAEPVSPVRRLLAGRSPEAVPAGWRTRLTAGLAGAALTVTALATLVAVSTGARPGDVLYGLKRGTEQTQLALAGDSRRGQTLLDLASTRLDELEYLVSEGATALPVDGAPAGGSPVVLAAGPAAELVLRTLDTMDAQTTDGAAWLALRSVTADDARPLDDLAGWVAGQSDGLSALTGEMPEAARSGVRRLPPAAHRDRQAYRRPPDRPGLPRRPRHHRVGQSGPLPVPCPPAPAAGGGDARTDGRHRRLGGTPPAGPTAEVPGGRAAAPGRPARGRPARVRPAPVRTAPVRTARRAAPAVPGRRRPQWGAEPAGARWRTVHAVPAVRGPAHDRRAAAAGAAARLQPDGRPDVRRPGRRRLPRPITLGSC